MQYSLSHSLKGASFATSNPDDAGAYIAAVTAAGATVSAGQRAAIDTFYRTAKIGGYYSSLKRLYLPIWGVAAANAIDMITLASGTFNGSVTHGAGFVQGDGATGYFNMLVDPQDIGMTTASGSYFALAYDHPATGNRTMVGALDDNNEYYSYLFASTTQMVTTMNGPNAVLSVLRAAQGGVAVSSRTATNACFVALRTTSGYSQGSNQAGAAYAVPNGYNIYALAANYNNSGLNNPTSAKFGAYGAGTGLTGALAQSASLALKNLWETATGLTLP